MDKVIVFLRRRWPELVAGVVLAMVWAVAGLLLMVNAAMGGP